MRFTGVVVSHPLFDVVGEAGTKFFGVADALNYIHTVFQRTGPPKPKL